MNHVILEMQSLRAQLDDISATARALYDVREAEITSDLINDHSSSASFTLHTSPSVQVIESDANDNISVVGDSTGKLDE